MNRQPDKKNYLYGRLSHEDELAGDSNSIINQRKMLTKYAEENGFEDYEFLYDDGFSGADFDRPEFSKIIEEVENGNVATVIVKDMSRFGRDYLKVGYLTEVLFPQKGVRLIAINDNVDTLQGENDFAPMMNIFNEWYVRNTSRKIRSVWQAKGKSGERLAVIPKYGYRKDPDDNRRWIVDEESAAIVKRIFNMSVDGFGPAEIARRLNGKHILNPSSYKYEQGILSKPRPCKDPYFWNTTTVHKILDSQEYIGDTVNFKTYSNSYKDNKCRFNNPEDWLIFENTHPAIIDKETWDIVRKMREHKRRIPKYGIQGLFSGVVYCSDCESKLYYSSRKIQNTRGTRIDGAYSCSAYRKQRQYLNEYGRGCTAHYINEKFLEQLVLEDLRALLHSATQYEEQFVKLVMEKNTKEQHQDVERKKKIVSNNRCRIEEIDILFERLYMDNFSGKITDERYEKMSGKFEEEQANLKEITATLENEIEEMELQNVNTDKFLSIVRKYTDIEELTPAIIHEFIDHIIIYEPDIAKGSCRVQKVEIIYNNIGMLTFRQLMQVRENN